MLISTITCRWEVGVLGAPLGNEDSVGGDYDCSAVSEKFGAATGGDEISGAPVNDFLDVAAE